MKKFLFAIIVSLSIIGLSSCEKDEYYNEAIAYFHLKKGDDCMVQSVDVKEIDSLYDITRYHVRDVKGLVGNVQYIENKIYYTVYKGTLFFDYVEVTYYADVRVYCISYLDGNKVEQYDVVFFKNQDGKYELLTQDNVCDFKLGKDIVYIDDDFTFNDPKNYKYVCDGWVNCIDLTSNPYWVVGDCMVRVFDFMESMMNVYDPFRELDYEEEYENNIESYSTKADDVYKIYDSVMSK